MVELTGAEVLTDQVGARVWRRRSSGGRERGLGRAAVEARVAEQVVEGRQGRLGGGGGSRGGVREAGQGAGSRA